MTGQEMEQVANKGRTWQAVSRALVAVALLYLATQLLPGWRMWLEQSRDAIAFPYGLDYGEGPVLDQAIGLARLEMIYRRPGATPPFTLANYPPLYPLAQAPFVAAFGPALWYGRVINLASLLGACLFLGLTIWRTTRSLAGSLAAGLLLPTIPFIAHWSAFVRVDSLALLFVCAGLWSAAGIRRASGVDGATPPIPWGALLPSILLFACAIFTRQSTGLAGPLAAFVWIFRQDWRRGLGFGFGLGALCGALALALNLASGGGFFFDIVTANVNPFGLDPVKNYAGEIWAHLPGLVVGAGIFGALGWWKGRPAWWLVAPFLAGALASALTIGKSGSNVNYLFELCAALCLGCGALVGALPRLWIQATLTAALAWQLAPMTAWTAENYLPRVYGKIDDRAAVAQLARLVAAADGDVLADEWMALVPIGGKRLAFQPFELKQLADAGLWDDGALSSRIARGEYGLILLYDPPDWDSRRQRWTEHLLYAVEARYKLVGRVSDTLVYEP